MSIEHLDFMSSDYEQIVFKQQEKLEEVAAKEKRWDEGVICLEWLLSRSPTQHYAVLSPSDVLGFLGAITLYAAVGRKSTWMQRVQADMGRA